MPSGRKNFLPHLRVRAAFRENQRKVGSAAKGKGNGSGKDKREDSGTESMSRPLSALR
jgi:hypothetical protein